MFTIPKLKELQRPKPIHKLPLLPATSTPSFMQRRNAIKTSCRGCDDLYHACTFAWGILMYVQYICVYVSVGIVQ